MKYLLNYTDEAVSEAIKNAGAFFAFSDKQFNEAKKDGVKYTSLFAGLICPTNNAKKLLDDISTAHENGIKQDIAENGINNIIARELSNHEAYYTGDITSTINALAGYNVSEQAIRDVFKRERVNHYND